MNDRPLKRIKRELFPTDATLKTYGITPASEFEAIAARQGGRCALCRVSFGGAPGAIDHDHRTGDVRGLLCQHCNTGLGFFRDNPEALQRAVYYLEDAAQRREDWVTREILGRHVTEIAPPALIVGFES